MSRIREIGASVLAMVVLLSGAIAHADVERLFRLAPNDAVAVVAAPHLRNFNDAIVQTLDGMDRSTAIFGSRPIDQLKSILRVTVAVNELKPAAIVFVPGGDGKPGVELVWLVPVTNASDFLNGNFERIGEQSNTDDSIQRLRHRHFGELYAKVIDEHVALTQGGHALERWQAEGKLAEGLQSRLNDAGRRTLRSGDIVLWVGDCGDERWRAFIAAWLDRLEALWPAMKPMRAVLSDPFPEGAADGILTIDLDPLGLFIRAWSRLEGDIALAPAQPAGQGRHLRSLPREPYQLALAMDQRGVSMSRRISRRLGWHRLDASLASLQDIEQLDVAAYADSPGGVMGRAVAVMRGAEASLIIAITEATMPWQAASHDRVWRESSAIPLRADVRLNEYSVRLPPDSMHGFEMLPPLLYGPAGWQGYVLSEGDRAAMTFSRATRSLDIARNALAGAETPLADDPVMRSMKGWLPESPALIGFVNVSAVMEHLRPMIQPMLLMKDMRMPEVGPSLPPVAAAVAVDGPTVEATLIIPAGVLAIGYDLAGERFIRQRLLTPNHKRDETADEPQ